MITYALYVRILGGEWKQHPASKNVQDFAHLEDALGMAETIKSEIKETQIAQVTTGVWFDDEGKRHVTKRYELI